MEGGNGIDAATGKRSAGGGRVEADYPHDLVVDQRSSAYHDEAEVHAAGETEGGRLRSQLADQQPAGTEAAVVLLEEGRGADPGFQGIAKG
ncbi:hypothetical protein D3C80_1840590 [compost metagenome]